MVDLINVIETIKDRDYLLDSDLLKTNIFDVLFNNKYNTNGEYIYDKKINIFKKDMTLNEKIIEEMNNKNSGFHAYQMIINKKTRTFMTLSETITFMSNGGNKYHIATPTHCGYHFNINVDGSPYTCYSFHTSQSNFFYKNNLISNIKFMDEGIKFVNPITIMPTHNFNQYFVVLNDQTKGPIYHKSIDIIQIYYETMHGAKLALQNEKGYFFNNNEIEIFNKMQKIDITNIIIENFNEKTINDAYFKQFMRHLLDKTNYPKEIIKLANKSIY